LQLAEVKVQCHLFTDVLFYIVIGLPVTDLPEDKTKEKENSNQSAQHEVIQGTVMWVVMPHLSQILEYLLATLFYYISPGPTLILVRRTKLWGVDIID